eukprot:CAMPEP_0172707726 /NCGR_PEP_ID=MMETSP1074-20121228/50140_1 /TAXON_ID=2916 /ORGANISM="Ceratium fusus, Strain PA161109" /LENGTH=35 /DNA_ID= /DNA_START= /DNA_END= /DNA_ORIENTATION=
MAWFREPIAKALSEAEDVVCDFMYRCIIGDIPHSP